MNNELPTFRLGIAGFASDEQQAIERVLHSGAGEAATWEVGDADNADAWWLNGARTQSVGGGRIRVAPAIPTAHALQMHLPDIDRPVAFAEPVPPGVEARCKFNLEAPGTMKAVLQQFDAWFAPVVAQFCLASHVVEHQSALGAGQFELRVNSELLAVVDMHGDAAVRGTAGPADFEEAVWSRAAGGPMPENFVHSSLSQLMWQYALRTQRDVLPRHYRTGLLYFRRAPRLPQSLLKDSHLLVMRELVLAPGTFADLMQRCGMDDARLARELAALYFVGSITSNPKRAARAPNEPSTRSHLVTVPDSEAPADSKPLRQVGLYDLTAPAPLRPDR
ncbi:hypothetical protein [Ramlibacter sp. PS4R-6]|uniref:hypothetical protein n=1 Tax=Ramlibacter sp. PS4R-6 TaxID=3133438 RepID=UPI0030B26AF4